MWVAKRWPGHASRKALTRVKRMRWFLVAIIYWGHDGIWGEVGSLSSESNYGLIISNQWSCRNLGRFKKWTPRTFCLQGFARLDRLGNILSHRKSNVQWIKSLGFWGEQQNIACRRWSNRATYLVDFSESVRCFVTMQTSSCWWNMSCYFNHNFNLCYARVSV